MTNEEKQKLEQEMNSMIEKIEEIKKKRPEDYSDDEREIALIMHYGFSSDKKF